MAAGTCTDVTCILYVLMLLSVCVCACVYLCVCASMWARFVINCINSLFIVLVICWLEYIAQVP